MYVCMYADTWIFEYLNYHWPYGPCNMQILKNVLFIYLFSIYLALIVLLGWIQCLLIYVPIFAKPLDILFLHKLQFNFHSKFYIFEAFSNRLVFWFLFYIGFLQHINTSFNTILVDRLLLETFDKYRFIHIPFNSIMTLNDALLIWICQLNYY